MNPVYSFIVSPLFFTLIWKCYLEHHSNTLRCKRLAPTIPQGSNSQAGRYPQWRSKGRDSHHWCSCQNQKVCLSRPPGCRSTLKDNNKNVIKNHDQERDKCLSHIYQRSFHATTSISNSLFIVIWGFFSVINTNNLELSNCYTTSKNFLKSCN